MMRRIIIGLNLLAPLVAIVLWLRGEFWGGLATLFAAHMLALYATVVPSCAWWGPVCRRIGSEGETVWLTIDDGPDPVDTPAVLEILEAHQAKATFFLIGENAERWPDLVRAIEAAGHGVGNHTMTHPKFSFWCLGPRRVKSEVLAAQEAIGAIVEVPPKLFRAPAGMRNLFVHPVLARLDLRLVGWSVRGRDGVSIDRDAIVTRLSQGLEAGAILLMHEGMRDGQGLPVIVDTLPRVLEAMELRGLTTSLPKV
ncbi:MAG: polysaccharide deacetylase family protein [Verrucomicrobiales bacterium]